MTAVEWLINEMDMQYPEINVRRKEWMVEQAKEMEKEQLETLLSYIQEVRDLCGKLRFPTEEELRELIIKADVILETFKPEQQ